MKSRNLRNGKMPLWLLVWSRPLQIAMAETFFVNYKLPVPFHPTAWARIQQRQRKRKLRHIIVRGIGLNMSIIYLQKWGSISEKLFYSYDDKTALYTIPFPSLLSGKSMQSRHYISIDKLNAYMSSNQDHRDPLMQRYQFDEAANRIWNPPPHISYIYT